MEISDEGRHCGVSIYHQSQEITGFSVSEHSQQKHYKNSGMQQQCSDRKSEVHVLCCSLFHQINTERGQGYRFRESWKPSDKTHSKGD